MESLARLGSYLRALPPWRARLAAFLLGAASALGFAPFGAFPLLLLGFAGLVLLIDGAETTKRAAWIGWAFGFGQFLIGLHWIGYAFLVDASAHEWQIPFVAILFPGGLALFFAAGTAAAARYWKPGPSRIFALTVALSLSEWLRGNILTGFPWNIPGYGWGASLGVMQSVALFGVYGLSVLTILLGASLALLAERRPVLPLAMTALFALFFLGGEIRLAATKEDMVDGVRLRIVQPNIAQADKYKPALIERNWNRLIALSTAPAKIPPTHIVWPEAAPPFVLTRSAVALDEIAVLTGRDKVLMTGALRALRKDDGVRYYNSFYVFGHGGQLLAAYDKFHLVPFGEYLPYEDLFAKLGLKKLVGIEGSFSTGDGPHTVDIPGAPEASPLICYEILFPGEVVADARARWIVNVTDDSWFGPWAGPEQHLLVARTRAIEQGLPVVRAANTGISAVIDSLGRVRARLGLEAMGTVDSGLPAPIEPPPFARGGAFAFWLLVLAMGASAVLAVQNRVGNE
ncbi:MAG TPA: apolipoprotein N-acyltransferase [Rhizomicrobium sp.]|nr:apolipoprotein N-acyltransferase [Rhizomicrobium sp.]